MKKYLKLTTNEAIRHFIMKDSTLAPETPEEVRTKLDELSKFKSELSVSITLPTHRTRPDSHKDEIVLKNLVSQAERELAGRMNKRMLASVMENINEARQAIDFSLNLEGMVLYANEHFSSVVKVPVPLAEKVTLGNDFDLSPLYKTRQQNSRYYILIVSKHNVRLIEAYNDKVVEEVDNDDFPFENTDYYTTDREKLAQDVFVDNLTREFFNQADKNFKKYYNLNPLPIIMMGDVKTVSYYESQMDIKDIVLGYVQGNYEKMPLHEVMKHAYPVVEAFRHTKLRDISEAIEKASSSGLITNDPDEMFREAAEGNAARLILGNNYDMAEGVEDGGQEPAGESLTSLITQVCGNGGEIVYAEDAFLEGYGGAVMIKRYDLEKEASAVGNEVPAEVAG